VSNMRATETPAPHERRNKLIAEAARELRKSERWLRDWLKQHPRDDKDEPFYRLAGRTKLFTDRDIDCLRQRDLLAEFKYWEQEDRLRTLGKFERLGVLPADDDWVF